MANKATRKASPPEPKLHNEAQFALANGRLDRAHDNEDCSRDGDTTSNRRGRR